MGTLSTTLIKPIPHAIATLLSAAFGFAGAYFLVHVPQIEAQKTQNEILQRQLEVVQSSASQSSVNMRAQTEELAKQTQIAISEKKRADRQEQRAILAEEQAHQRDIENAKIETRLEIVRTQIRQIGSGFADDLYKSSRDAYNIVTSETPAENAIGFARELLRSREKVREKLKLVDENVRIIYDATNSLFDQLRNELARPQPRKETLRDLMNRIYEQSEEMISRVNSSVDVILGTLECRKNVLLAQTK